MGGGIFRSWLALPPFGWPNVGGAEVAERGEDDPEETDGIGESPGGKIFLYCFITYKSMSYKNQRLKFAQISTFFEALDVKQNNIQIW